MSVKKNFRTNGFAKLDRLISQEEVGQLLEVYNNLLKDRERTSGLRSDLGGGATKGVEKITQIMRPSLLEPKIQQHRAYTHALEWAKILLGEDMALDFDMLINKAPFTDTSTPWHQDAAYWIKMPDKRAVSCWLALDEARIENGCMWFIPTEKQEGILPHQRLPGGGALYCEPDTRDAQAIPLPAGSCTFHGGYTLHFSQGNSTSGPRRAWILNFRPQEMIDLERSQGVDHTGERKVRNT